MFLGPLISGLLPTGDKDIAETVGFLLMFVFVGLGLTMAIAAACVLSFAFGIDEKPSCWMYLALCYCLTDVRRSTNS
jgi:hypothetical protein